MNIIVCVKQVPDPSIVRFNIDTDSMTNISYMINPPDEVAVAEAIRIRERAGEGEVTVISLGPDRVERALRICLTRGVDQAIHLCDKMFDNLDACVTSTVLARAIARLQYDLILCGNESADEGNGFVGAGLAEGLDLPLVSAVTRIEVLNAADEVRVHRRIACGDREIIESRLPAVLTVDAGLGPAGYYPLKTILAGLRKTIIRWDAASLDVDAGDISPTIDVISIAQSKPRLKETVAVNSDLPASERLRLLMSGGRSGKSAKSVDKDPEAAASEIMRFLIDNRIVPGS